MMKGTLQGMNKMGNAIDKLQLYKDEDKACAATLIPNWDICPTPIYVIMPI
jgi:hypothetical protein